MRHTAKLLTFMLMVPVVASAQILKFEGINPTYPSTSYPAILDFYNGGLSGAGTSGTNFGISFTPNALNICLNTIGFTSGCSNTSRGGLGDPTSRQGGLFWLSGSQTFMNVAGGFTGGFSFFYAAYSQGGAVQVFDGLNGTGSLLATLNLTTTPSDCPPGYNAAFCTFRPAGVSFGGTARSVGWGGVANQIVFDDVTIGSSTPGTPSDVVPEPATMTLLATGLAGIAAARKKRKA